MIQRKSLNHPDGSIAFPRGEGTHARVGAIATRIAAPMELFRLR